MKFKAPDGKEFDNRKDWREYVTKNFYSFKEVVDTSPPFKEPGTIDGQGFDIADCSSATLGILDHSEQVQIDACKKCKIFIPACTSSIFIRECEDCVFYTCCRQLRLRDVVNCTFYIFSMSEVHIEFSKGLKFAPFNGGYPEHAKHLQAANLNVTQNLWYDIYDHNDSAKTRENWSLLPDSEWEAPWWPKGECEAAIVITKPDSVAKAEPPASEMQSFSLKDMMAEAERQTAAAIAAGAGADAATADGTDPTSGLLPPPIPMSPKGLALNIPPTQGSPERSRSASRPVPMTSPMTEGSETEKIARLIKLFCSFKVGGNLSSTVDYPSFRYIGPTGKTLSATDIEAAAPLDCGRLWSLGDISISASADLAYVSYYAWIGGDSPDALPPVCAFTACLAATEEGWRLVMVQSSSPISIEDLPPSTMF